MVTVHNQNPPSYKIGSSMRIERKSPDVLSAFIASLNDSARVGVANAFANGRGKTREQLINDLQSGELLLHPLDYYKVNYAIIRDTDPRPSYPEPKYVPFYDPDKPDEPYVSRYTDVELEPFLKQLDLTAAAERAAPREEVEANAAAVRAKIEREKAVMAEAEANAAASGPEANAKAVRAKVAVLAADRAEDHALQWARWIEKKNAQP